MRSPQSRSVSVKNLLALAAIGELLVGLPSQAQIYLNPIQPNVNRSRTGIDLTGDGMRCSSDGGAVPTLSMSVGVVPGQTNNVIVNSQTSQGPVLGLLTLSVPLERTDQKFDCNNLLQDAQVKARMENLRTLLDESVITEAQYRQGLIRILNQMMPQAVVDNGQMVTERRLSLVLGDQQQSSPAPATTLPSPGSAAGTGAARITPRTQVGAARNWMLPPPALPQVPESVSVQGAGRAPRPQSPQ